MRVFGEDDGFFFFFGDKDADAAGRAHGANEDVVADYVELLLVVASYIGGAGEAGELEGNAELVMRNLSGSMSVWAQLTLIREARRM